MIEESEVHQVFGDCKLTLKTDQKKKKERKKTRICLQGKMKPDLGFDR